MARALNNTGKGARVDVSKTLRQELTLKASTIKRGVTLRKRATPSRLATDLGISSQPNFLSDFSFRGPRSTKGKAKRGRGRRRKSGVSVRVSRTGGAKRHERAFVLTFRSGKKAIAQAEKAGEKAPILTKGRNKGKRGNILLYSTSLAKRVERRSVHKQIERLIAKRLQTNIKREVRFALRRRLGLRMGGRRR